MENQLKGFLKKITTKQYVSQSLIPIKGISKAMQLKLNSQKIYDIPSLLLLARTKSQRTSISTAIGVDVKLLESWVKQADLWRVPEMSPDLAYLLVQVGIRSIEDLSMMSASKAMPILQRLYDMQPDFIFNTNDQGVLVRIVDAAKSLLNTSIAGNSYRISIEVSGDPPKYIFEDKADVLMKSNSDAIEEGVNTLKNLGETLPLPHVFVGVVYLKDNTLPYARVELQGILSPTSDLKESSKMPSAYTDADGKFEITMPDKYNFHESVTLNITVKSPYPQVYAYSKSASDILQSVLDYELVAEFKQLYGVKAPSPEEIKKNSEQYSNEINEAITSIIKQKQITANLGDIKLADITADANKSALPSVRLMGNDNNPIRLNTDTSPSRIFSYGMIQRLVEPSVYPNPAPGKQRITLNSPLDVSSFKDQLYTAPGSIPKMSSLGIGYVLNMHQAWVPCGFALGNLLYSLILAPGEEQRIVVRETSQSYTIADTAEGSDFVSEDYSLQQEDYVSAAYDYAVSQLSTANSDYKYSTKASGFGGSAAAGSSSKASGSFSKGPISAGISAVKSAMFGLSGSYAKSSGSGSSSARQSNTHNEASNAAQNFQHGIKSASEKIAQAKRISISTATSSESESVATKIIANHNHSHAMTLQYWEVMRQYRMETCIDDVTLVLFIPMQIISFLPGGQSLFINGSDALTQRWVNDRYRNVLKYATIFQSALPFQFRNGLNILRKYNSIPSYTVQSPTNSASKFYTLTVKGNFLSFDNVSAVLVLKNGNGSIAATNVIFKGDAIPSAPTKDKLLQAIRDKRNEVGTVTYTCSFEVAGTFVENDLSHIVLTHSCDNLEYTLKAEEGLTDYQKEAFDNYKHKLYNFAEDDTKSGYDMKKAEHFKSILPESVLNPEVYLTSSQLSALGGPIINTVSLSGISGNFSTALSSSTLNNSVYINITSNATVLRYNDLQKIEAMFQHVIENTLHYSQRIWSSLTDDERAILLERYTIDISMMKKANDIVNDGTKQGNTTNNSTTNNETISLLNCVNNKNPLGFYGNCILLPFSMPKEIAKKLEITAGELQDSIYRYHTNCFRVPTTTISLPTDGMVGEAVLGETNVSELIDLTRFWNWKDSDIDHMDINADYLKKDDILDNVKTKEFTSTPTGVTAATPVQVGDLISALVSKNVPSFANITGQDQLKDILNNATTTTATGRDNIINKNTDLLKSLMNQLNGKMTENENQGKGNGEGTKSGTGNDNGKGQGDNSKPSTGNDNGKAQGDDTKPITGNDNGKEQGDDTKPGTGNDNGKGQGDNTKPITGNDNGKGQDNNSKPSTGNDNGKGQGDNTKPGTGNDNGKGQGDNTKPSGDNNHHSNDNSLNYNIPEIEKYMTEDIASAALLMSWKKGRKISQEELERFAKKREYIKKYGDDPKQWPDDIGVKILSNCGMVTSNQVLYPERIYNKLKGKGPFIILPKDRLESIVPPTYLIFGISGNKNDISSIKLNVADVSNGQHIVLDYTSIMSKYSGFVKDDTVKTDEGVEIFSFK